MGPNTLILANCCTICKYGLTKLIWRLRPNKQQNHCLHYTAFIPHHYIDIYTLLWQWQKDGLLSLFWL